MEIKSNLECKEIFLSTLPARGATYKVHIAFFHVLISIHAPREGSDALTAPTGKLC